jgi:cystathionine beta-lyase family protein involved in aluminum resistance
MNTDRTNYKSIDEICARAEADIVSALARIDAVSFENTKRILAAFEKNRVSEACFSPTTGYGYNDSGRDTLDRVFADALGTESALVRAHFINGTHAIACALFGILRPGDTLLCATGSPYDTLLPVIYGAEGGSLTEYGVKVTALDFLSDGRYDEQKYLQSLAGEVSRLKPRAVLIQRSRGYSLRPPLSVRQINSIVKIVKSVSGETITVVDNCYGEFVETSEPATDLLCGSLIKNPGGGLAPTGGYIAGSPALVELAACRLGVPGIGGEAGSYAAGYRLFYQGLFLAPHTVAQALKTAVFAARALELAGFETSPLYSEERHDIIQTVTFRAPRPMLAFIRGIQAGSPVDSYVTPEPWNMPGYEDKVVMAAGAFVSGSSIELSADAPMREPYTAYLQGGLTYESGRLGILRSLSEILGKR